MIKKINNSNNLQSINKMQKIEITRPSMLGGSLLKNTQRAFLMCKPDAVARGLATKLIMEVSDRLNEKGIKHRIVAPKIIRMTPELAKIFYKDLNPDLLNNRVMPYICGIHENPKVPQAPAVSFIIEAYTENDTDLISILRSDDLIGPTRINVKVLNDPNRADNVKKSIRYKYTIGENVSQRPFDESPVMNCIHCSSSKEEASREISTIYKKEELFPYYEGSVLNTLYDDLKGNDKTIRDNAVSIPLLDIANLPKARFRRYISRLLPSLMFRDFSKNNILHLNLIAQTIMKYVILSDDNFLSRVWIGDKFVNGISKSKVSLKNVLKVIGISGFTGSGKTSLSKSLAERGNFHKIALVTTRRPRNFEVNNEDYFFVTDKAFKQMFRNDEFIACEEAYGNCYGITKETIKKAILSGKNLIVTGGIHLLDDVYEYLNLIGVLNKTHRFASILTKLPGKNDNEKANNIKSRLTSRDGSTKRIESIQPENISHYEAYENRFDYIITNKEGKIESTILKINDFIKSLDKIDPIDYKKRYDNNLHWLRIEAGLRLTDVLNILNNAYKKYNGLELNVIENKLSALKEELILFFDTLHKLSKQLPEINAITYKEAILHDNERVADHTLATFASMLQLGGDSIIIERTERRIGRLPHLNKDKYSKIFKELKAIANSISRDNKIFLTLLHDIGKAIRYPRHPEYSYLLLDRLALDRWFPDLTREDKDINTLIVQYHVIFSSFFNGDAAASTLHKMFSNPKVKKILSLKNGKVNLPAVEKFLDRVIFMSIVDVAGSGGREGALNNTKVEAYLTLAEQIFHSFTSLRDSYDKALRVIELTMRKYTLHRIAFFIGFSDDFMDQKENPLEQYLSIAKERADKAIKNGDITEKDWKLVLNTWHRIEGIPYCPLIYLPRIQPSEKGSMIIKGLNQEVEPSFYKFLTIIAKVIQKNDFPTKYIELSFRDSNNKIMSKRDKIKNAVLKMHDLLMSSTTVTVEENGKLYIKGKDGSIIKDIEITSATERVLSEEEERSAIYITIK